MARVKFYIKNWMEFINLEELKVKLNGKEVLLYIQNAEEVKKFLENGGISVKGSINPNAYEENKKLLAEGNYFVIAGYREDKLVDLFYDCGLKEMTDFLFVATYKELSTVGGYYKDSCGNEIICEGEVTNVNISLQGYNNKLYIGKDFGCGGTCQIKLKGNASLTIGRNFYCKSGQMFLRNSTTIMHGDTYLAGNYFISNFEGYMEIGKGMEVTDGLYICVVENTKLTIGEDCLVAKDVKILSGGAHSLYDLDLKENINMKENVHVTIGNHVWLGMGSQIIYNTDIGSNSMVGAGSLVKGSYPEHSLIAGSIAKVLRTNIDWHHEDYVSYDEFVQLH